MERLITAKNEAIDCDVIVKSDRMNFLHIHTKALGWAAASTIFSDADQTIHLKVIDENGNETKEFDGYTTLHSIEVSPFIGGPGELMIWLEKTF